MRGRHNHTRSTRPNGFIALIDRRNRQQIPVVLTKRDGELTWGFPGGEGDSKDNDVKGTALRELYEETGIKLRPCEAKHVFPVETGRHHTIFACYYIGEHCRHERMRRFHGRRDKTGEVHDYGYVQFGEHHPVVTTYDGTPKPCQLIDHRVLRQLAKLFHVAVSRG